MGETIELAVADGSRGVFELGSLTAEQARAFAAIPGSGEGYAISPDAVLRDGPGGDHALLLRAANGEYRSITIRPDGMRLVWTAVLADIAGEPTGSGDTVEQAVGAAVAAAGLARAAVALSGPDGNGDWAVVAADGEYRPVLGMVTREAVPVALDPADAEPGTAVSLTWFEADEPERLHQHRGRVRDLTPPEVMGIWCREVLDMTLPELLEYRVQGGYDGTLAAWLDVVREVGEGLLLVFPDTDGGSIIVTARYEE